MNNKNICKWCKGVGGYYVFSSAMFYYCTHCQPEKAAIQKQKLDKFRWILAWFLFVFTMLFGITLLFLFLCVI